MLGCASQQPARIPQGNTTSKRRINKYCFNVLVLLIISNNSNFVVMFYVESACSGLEFNYLQIFTKLLSNCYFQKYHFVHLIFILLQSHLDFPGVLLGSSRAWICHVSILPSSSTFHCHIGSHTSNSSLLQCLGKTPTSIKYYWVLNKKGNKSLRSLYPRPIINKVSG